MGDECDMKKIKFIFLFFIICSTALYSDDIEDLMQDNIKKYEAELLATDTSNMNTVKANVIDVVGQVYMKYDTDKSWQQLLIGDSVSEMATVIALEESEAIIKLLNDTEIFINENTKAYFYNLKQSPNKKELTETGIKLFTGKIFSNVKNIMNTGSKYEIDTGSATAGVRGTKFLVELDDNKEANIKVYEGAVYVLSKEANLETTIERNEKMRIDRYGNFEKKEKHEESIPTKRKEASKKKEKDNLREVNPKWVKDNLKEGSIQLDEEDKENLVKELANIDIKPSSDILEESQENVSDRARLLLKIK